MPFQKGGFALNATHPLPFINQTFIRVRCVDEEGKPLAKRPYEIELPDGERVRGELDDDGWAKHEGIKPGECQFRLLDPEDILPEPGPKGPHFINVVVKDEEGRPLVDEPYILGVGDGSVLPGDALTQLLESARDGKENGVDAALWFVSAFLPQPWNYVSWAIAIGVSIRPGMMTLARMPNRAFPIASACV